MVRGGQDSNRVLASKMIDRF